MRRYMPKVLHRKNTIGSLNRRFQRDMIFQSEETVSGPAATHAGLNEGIALRFGRYKPTTISVSFRIFKHRVLIGKNAGLWASMSDMEASWIYWPRLAVSF